MKNTHFHDDYTEIVKNRAYSYEPVDSGVYRNSILSYSTVGPTSLFTTVEDEIKWLNNYSTKQVGGEDAINQMHELGILNSGDTLSYAFGLRIDNYKGWRRIGHGGWDAGFKTYAVRFPEKMARQKSNKKRYNFLIDSDIYDDFSAICEKKGLVRSKKLEIYMKEFIEKNKKKVNK